VLNKKITVILLFSLAFFLMLANLVITTKEEEAGENKNLFNSAASLTGAEAKEIFTNVLKEFDVDTLVVKMKTKKKSYYSVRVKLPSDLPVPLIIKELYSRFEKSDVVIIAGDSLIKHPRDKKNEPVTYLTLKGSKTGLMEVIFQNDMGLIREKGELAFYINNFSALSHAEFQYLLTYPENLGFELLPTKEAKDTKEIISENRKESGIILSDEISDIDYKVDSKYSKKRLLMSVKLLIGAFPEYNYFLIDKDAEIYNSTAFPYLESEFNKRDYRIIPTYKFDYIDGESEEVILHKFNSISGKTLKGDNVIISISYDNFIVIQDAIKGLKKKGVRIVPPSKIITAE